MPLTREERQILEKLVKKVGKLESRIVDLEYTVNILKNQVVGSGNLDFGSQSTDEIRNLIEDAVEDIINDNMPKHNHTDDSNGGDAFAKLGASLID